MKRLSQKNLFYSVLLAAVMMLFLIGYFILMLPQLYVAHMKEQNLKAVKEQHRAFIEKGNYDGVKVKNPTACISVKVPLEGDYISLTSKMISVKVTAKEAEIKAMLNELQDMIRTVDTKQTGPLIKERLEQWQERLKVVYQDRVSLPIELEVIHTEGSAGEYYNESYKVHASSGRMIVLESSVEDGYNQYTTYLAFEKVSDGMVFSLLPVITPQMEEIRPVVIQSLPMLGAVILILVLVFSQIYSGGIVSPVLKELQAANQRLLEENERQEVFLRASSHQLKTPVTAALLLLDGMIDQIGKYKDTRTYLPKVKEHLLYMRKMVDEILSLNRSRDNMDEQELCLYAMVQTQLAVYHIAAADKRLEIVLEGDEDACIHADRDILCKILDNLLSNAVDYTPQHEKITIWAGQQRLVIRNEGTVIEQDLLQHIFEPFVRGEHEKQSHGLGLYIAAYYAKLIGARLTVQNRENSVEAVLDFD